MLISSAENSSSSTRVEANVTPQTTISIAASPGPAQGHFGLSGIRERVQRRNGEMSVESMPGKGTSVTVSLRTGEEDRDEQ